MTPAAIPNRCRHGRRIMLGITCHLCRFDQLVTIMTDSTPETRGFRINEQGEKNHDDERPSVGRADRDGSDDFTVGGDHRRDRDRVALIGLRLDTAQARLACARARTDSSIDVIADHMARLREFRAAREAYRTAVAELLGDTPDIIARRLAL